MNGSKALLVLALALVSVSDAAETLAGCVSEDLEIGSYRLTTGSGERVRISGGLDLADQVGHQVQLKGDFVESLHLFQATEVKELDDDCDQKAKLTADDQGSSREDINTTRKIRQAIIDDDSLSVAAQNIKVITLNGTVTLEGQVPSKQEMRKLGAKAEAVAGKERVRNRLTVKREKAGE